MAELMVGACGDWNDSNESSAALPVITPTPTSHSRNFFMSACSPALRCNILSFPLLSNAQQMLYSILKRDMDAQLKQEIRFLTTRLGAIVREQAGDKIF